MYSVVGVSQNHAEFGKRLKNTPYMGLAFEPFCDVGIDTS